ncbi:MAG: hypothetical protein WD645_03510 [Dehalococcoidia bacterium]
MDQALGAGHPAFSVDASIRGHQAVSVLAGLALRGHVPQTIAVQAVEGMSGYG